MTGHSNDDPIPVNTEPVVPTFRPIIGLVESFEVSTHTDSSALGVIVSVDDHDWRIVSVRYGTPEPAPRSYPSKWAAALALTDFPKGTPSCMA